MALRNSLGKIRKVLGSERGRGEILMLTGAALMLVGGGLGFGVGMNLGSPMQSRSDFIDPNQFKGIKATRKLTPLEKQTIVELDSKKPLRTFSFIHPKTSKVVTFELNHGNTTKFSFINDFFDDAQREDLHKFLMVKEEELKKNAEKSSPSEKERLSKINSGKYLPYLLSLPHEDVPKYFNKNDLRKVSEIFARTPPEKLSALKDAIETAKQKVPRDPATGLFLGLIGAMFGAIPGKLLGNIGGDRSMYG